MQINLLTLPLLLTFALSSMHLKRELINFPSLKIIAALKVSLLNNVISKEEAPEEIIDLVNTIKDIKNCSYDQQKLFINLLNNPEIDIERYFPIFIRIYLRHEKLKNKQQLFNSMLLDCVLFNEVRLVKLLINFGADVNCLSSHGSTLLMHNRRNSKEIIQILLDNGADVTIENNWGENALLTLVQCRNTDIRRQMTKEEFIEIVRTFLERGANPNAHNREGVTILMMAAKGLKKEIIQLLIDYGADLDYQDKDGRTALIWAALNGDKKIIKILLANEANVNIADKDGYIAKTLAAKHDYYHLEELFKTNDIANEGKKTKSSNQKKKN